MKGLISRIIIFAAIAGLLAFPIACKKADEPPKPQVSPAPAPVPEKKAEEPAAVPEKKAEKPAPVVEKNAAKAKVAEPVKTAKAAPEKKVAAPAPQKEITEDSIYLTQAIRREVDGIGCTETNDRGKQMKLAMADAKTRAVDQVIADIKAKTKSPELKNALVSAYSNASLQGFKVIRTFNITDEKKGYCCNLKAVTEVVPDPEKMKKLMK
jgi:outer membrane biosynthesis protein TonB